MRERWSSGSFTADTVEKTALLSANAVGQCEVLSQLIDLEANQLFPEQASE